MAAIPAMVATTATAAPAVRRPVDRLHPQRHLPHASKQKPTAVFDIDVPANTPFRSVAIDVDVYHGGWFPRAPQNLHSILWLHRGRWLHSRWKGNIFGFLNAFGPSSNQVKLVYDDERGNKTRLRDSVGAAPGHDLPRALRLRQRRRLGVGDLDRQRPHRVADHTAAPPSPCAPTARARSWSTSATPTASASAPRCRATARRGGRGAGATCASSSGAEPRTAVPSSGGAADIAPQRPLLPRCRRAHRRSTS